MLIETTGGYFIKLKLHGVLYTVDSIVISKSVWHFISVRLAYPKSIRDLTRIIYDIIVDQESQPHTITMQADVWEQSTSDKLTIGDSRNSISVGQTLKISHVLFIPWYIVYVNPLGVEGQTGCLVALQSNDKSYTFTQQFINKVFVRSVLLCCTWHNPCSHAAIIASRETLDYFIHNSHCVGAVIGNAVVVHPVPASHVHLVTTSRLPRIHVFWQHNVLRCIQLIQRIEFALNVIIICYNIYIYNRW